MDPSIESTLAGKYPAKSHVHRVVHYLRSHNSDPGLEKSLIYLESAKLRTDEDADTEAPFRQRRYFYYLTGCELSDSVYTYDVQQDKSTLFIPPVVKDEVIWSGLPMLKEEALEKYDVDEVLTTADLESYLTSHSASSTNIIAIENQVSKDSLFSTFQTQDISLNLKTAIEECRVVKDDYEVKLTLKANYISGLAHRDVMSAARHARNERELSAIFLSRGINAGAPKQAYSSIVASGTDAATLHYVRNNKPITAKTLNLLLDAGVEYNCYASDITRTFPISGKFTKESAAVYALVLDMQKQCMSRLKAGVVWDEVHELAHRIAIAGLLDLGILRGNADEIFDARTSVAFFPHGLGHYMGMDVHDTGGHPNYADEDPMFRYLRVRGKLPAGCIITVEPGVYFCRFMIEPYLEDEKHAKYIDKEALEKYWEVGGVRIEDDVLVTQDGFENLTDVPKEIEELETLMAA